jgi:hypothetical protein
MIEPNSIAKLFVKASGENSAPSCPVSAKIGKKLTITSIRAKNIEMEMMAEVIRELKMILTCVFFSG